MSISRHRFPKGVDRCLHCGQTRAEIRALAPLVRRYPTPRMLERLLEGSR